MNNCTDIIISIHIYACTKLIWICLLSFFLSFSSSLEYIYNCTHRVCIKQNVSFYFMFPLKLNGKRKHGSIFLIFFLMKRIYRLPLEIVGVSNVMHWVKINIPNLSAKFNSHWVRTVHQNKLIHGQWSSLMKGFCHMTRQSLLPTIIL